MLKDRGRWCAGLPPQHHPLFICMTFWYKESIKSFSTWLPGIKQAGVWTYTGFNCMRKILLY
ncbi:hypothetical protein BC349_07725 [Flavihumibacter stibioxidans]|uniref:Uncharacterized protein n=1 Tax=Flavihumibacter stibioxidans TaxID=1834163 RepID=A0ABR7M7D2_9BACT|nr:hypothetical protein [Flavihumibacter stibioxidans]